MTIELLTGIVGVIGAIVAILLPIMKRPHEVMGMDASTAKTYAESARLSEERAREYCNDLEIYKTAQEQKFALLEQKYDELKYELEKATAEIETLREWSERLVHQVQSLGAEPVKMKPPRKIRQ